MSAPLYTAPGRTTAPLPPSSRAYPPGGERHLLSANNQEGKTIQAPGAADRLQRWLGLCALLVTFLALTGCAGQYAAAAAPFKHLRKEAAARCAAASGQAASAVPYRIGKVLVADMEGKVDGWAMSDQDLLLVAAADPSEVATLACVGAASKVTDNVIRYANNAPAYRLQREITLVEWATGQVIFRTTLVGGPPPLVLSGGVDYGSDPVGIELHLFLGALSEK